MERRVKGFKALSEESGLPIRTLRTLWGNGLLPGEKFGHRTIVFVLAKVERAMERPSVRELKMR